LCQPFETVVFKIGSLNYLLLAGFNHDPFDLCLLSS
jgi:hypothetical protein